MGTPASPVMWVSSTRATETTWIVSFRRSGIFGTGRCQGLAGPKDLEPEGTIVQFGQPPNRLDLINAIEGVEFGEAWEGRLEATMVGAARK